MMKKIQLVLFICFVFCTNYLCSQGNYILYSPLEQTVVATSNVTKKVEIRANCYGGGPYSVNYLVQPLQIPDNGYQIHHPGTGFLQVGNNQVITFSFRKTVSVTTKSTYTFRGIYYQNSNPITEIIRITVIYNPPPSCDLKAPSNTNTTNITENRTQLNWSFVSGNNGYQYQYKVSSSSSWSAKNTSNTSSTIINLQPDTNYDWKVAAKCSNGIYGNWSSVETFTTLSGCQDKVAIIQNVNSGEINNKQALNTITASNDINSGAIANYDAGITVFLKPSFHAKSGSSFRAFIRGCSVSNRSSVVSTIKEDPVLVDDESIEEEKDVKKYSRISIIAYPNPTTAIVTIKSPKNIIHYILSNKYGKQLLEKKVNTKRLIVDLLGWSKGIYVLELKNEKGEIVRKKIIKE